MTGKVHIAVLMTCHNRRDKTLRCLRSLVPQKLNQSGQTDVFLVDAGSTDGTRDAVRKEFPRVKLLLRDDSLFWCGGMRIAWKVALEGRYDYYLWLNDDVVLDPGAVAILLKTAQDIRGAARKPVIVTGAMRDPDTGATTYGGVTQGTGLRVMDFDLVEPGKDPVQCSTVHGNCVLITSGVVDKIGILSPEFTHGVGDYDYGLRAAKEGIDCWLAPGYVGTCPRNSPKETMYDADLPIRESVRKMQQPTGLPPANEWMRFAYRHAGLMWPVFWARTLVRVCVPFLWVIIRRRQVGEGAARG